MNREAWLKDITNTTFVRSSSHREKDHHRLSFLSMGALTCSQVPTCHAIQLCRTAACALQQKYALVQRVYMACNIKAWQLLRSQI